MWENPANYGWHYSLDSTIVRQVGLNYIRKLAETMNHRANPVDFGDDNYHSDRKPSGSDCNLEFLL